MKALMEKIHRRYLIEGLDIGKTVENDAIRAHRYSSAIRVTELLNAGKRGKKVDEFALYDLDRIQDPKMSKLIDQFAAMIPRTKNYKKLLAVAEGLMKTAKDTGQINPKIEKNVLRGVDVAPGGFKKVEINTPNLYGRAESDSFSVRDKKDTNNDPTIMTPKKGKDTAVKKFYKWISENESKWKSMSFEELRRALKKAGIEYHYYMGMD